MDHGLGIQECGFCLFENLTSAETGKKQYQLGPRLTSIFANVYAGQTIIEDPAPLAARGWGMTDQNLTCQNLKDAKRKMLRSVGAAQHDKL